MKACQLRTIKSLLLVAATLLIVGTSTPPALAAIINFDGVLGKVVGATGVDVDGVLYDVKFDQGTCIALFSNCDDPTDFATSLAQSTAL